MNDNNKCCFDNGDECSALKSKDCEKCSFRKTKAEHIAALERSEERLKRIGRVDVDDG